MTRLFHVSDVHFGAQDQAALDWFGRIVAAEVPDAIIMTGDLTMKARKREFEAAAKWLESLGRPTTVEVGNHDLPYYNPYARFVVPYRRYHALKKMIERPLDIQGIAIVPLRTTARAQWRLNWSKGNVSLRSLQETLALVEAVPKGDLIFVAAHHPLVEASTRTTSSTRGGAAALAALARAGVHAVLTGHVHDPFDIAHEVAGRTVRMIGAGTLSERVRVSRPSFNEIIVDGSQFTVVARTMKVALDAPENRLITD